MALLEGIVLNPNKNLKHLELNDANLMDEDTLCQLAIRLPQLETLSLEDCCNAVTDIWLKQVLKHQSKLQTLMLENCCRISDDSIFDILQWQIEKQNY